MEGCIKLNVNKMDKCGTLGVIAHDYNGKILKVARCQIGFIVDPIMLEAMAI